jgi:hypothetical protein
MPTDKQNTYHELYNSDVYALLGELELWGIEPSRNVTKDEIIRLLMDHYFGGEK